MSGAVVAERRGLAQKKLGAGRLCPIQRQAVDLGGRDDSLGPEFLAALHCDRPETVRTGRTGGLPSPKRWSERRHCDECPEGDGTY